jgi:PAS domain S-box-containing protein
VDTPTGETVSITFFAPDPDYFDEREIRLLHGVRNALTFAIAKLALDSRRLDAEEALAASERGYHTAFDSLPQPTMVYDIETMRFLAVNEAAISRYGYSRREFLTKSFDDICVMGEAPGHPGTVPKAERELAGEQVWTHRDAQRNEFSVLAFTRPMEWAGKHAEMLVVVEVARVA